MQLRVFGRTGMQLSVLGFGCGAVGGLMVRGTPHATTSASAIAGTKRSRLHLRVPGSLARRTPAHKSAAENHTTRNDTPYMPVSEAT